MSTRSVILRAFGTSSLLLPPAMLAMSLLGGCRTAEPVPQAPTRPASSVLALPSEAGAIARYLTHRYKGVGEKTAETLVEALGADLFRTMHEDPDAISRIVPKNRAEQVLEAWRADYERRAAAHSGRSGGDGSASGRTRSRGRGRS